MVELRKIRPTELVVVSTFSGCGGSCLGFEWAGFRVLWANEFVGEARTVYAANHPGVPIDDRDIRKVRGAEILAAIGRERGDVDVLEGSPPCASFSLAGDREKKWGKTSKYSSTKQRTDDLFFEFSRLVDEIQPRVFVAENVAGLAHGIAIGYFREIVAALAAAGYVVRSKILDAAWLGVPQSRRRVIIVGVRRDLGREPVFPKPLPYCYSIRDALPELADADVRTGNGTPHVASKNLPISTARPAPAIMAQVPHQLVVVGHGRSRQRRVVDAETPEMGTAKYALWREWEHLKRGEQSRRYFNLVRPDADLPMPTLTATGGTSNGTASVVHPTEKRKFTIAELRRLCGFPDDFVLTGTYKQRWERLGRAVPPPMMRAVAETIRREIFGK